MGAQFLELLKKVTVFMLAGQLIVHFLPAGGYEKYVKMMISIMVLSQIVLPILSLGKFDAAGVYDSAMDKYEQEIEKIGMQVEENDFEGRDYQEEALSMTVRQKLEPLMEQYGVSLKAVSAPEEGKLRVDIAEGGAAGGRLVTIENITINPVSYTHLDVYKRQELGKPKHEYTSCAVPEELFAAIKEIVPPAEMEEAVFTDVKQVREENIRNITARLEEAFADKEEWLPVLGEAIYQYQKKTVRKMILKDHKRPDGRAITQIRPLAAEIDIIPRVHGSGMFTRGQTQICTITTLAPLSEMQRIDGLDENEVNKRYMHHYNFPSYSVGETKPSRGPGRREIGHGALAEKALIPVLPTEDEFPYAIRTVSETFESNGSTSQASICASTLSLMAAGVPIKKQVAGISCGLVTGDTDDDYLVLTDIQGLEDFFGDMDFKVAGTHDGITAIQMDIKIHGLTRPIVEEAIAKTKEAREYIMNEVMTPCIAAPRAEVGTYAPKIISVQIDPEKIGDVVGQRGKTINEIIARTGVKIDITDDGKVSVCGTDKEMMDKAVEMVKIITTDFQEGQIFKGVVVSIKEFGAFIEFAPGKEGMVHISKIAKERINHVEDVLTLGDVVTVVCLGKDKMGRISFSMKDVAQV